MSRRNSILAAATAVLLAGVWLAVSGANAALGAWLWAWLFWLAPPAGSLALIMIHALTGGRWGDDLAPVLRPIAMALPFAALFFLPVLLGIHAVYPWAASADAAASPDVARFYLNIPGFVLRSLVILALWSGLSFAFAWRGRTTPRAAGLGLLVYAITASFAAVDWTMSIDPKFSSTAFGAAFIIGQILSALALAGILRAGAPQGEGGVSDLGGLILAALLGYVYLEFMQYLVVWAGNLPEKSAWYLLRGENGWGYAVPLAFATGAVLPFFMLLSTRWRRSPRIVGAAAALIFTGLLLFTLWQMAGVHEDTGPGLADFAVPLVFGALLLAWVRVPHAPLEDTQ